MKDESFSNGDFQIINMNYKLKKIKNKKKRNHEKKPVLLETLDNVSTPTHDDPAIPSFSGENIREPFIEGYPDNEYDGIDNVDDKGDSAGGGFDPRKWIIDMINYIYDYINSFNQYWASKIVKILSQGTGQKSDVDLVRNYIAWTESIAGGCYVVYNWFFILYYSKVMKVQLYNIDIEKIFTDAKTAMEEDSNIFKQLWYFLVIIIHYFFDYPINIMSLFNVGVTQLFPSIFSEYIFNSTFLFAILFFHSCQFLKHSARAVKELLINSIMFKVTPLSVIIYFTIVILWGKDLILTIKKMTQAKPASHPVSYVLYILERLLKLMLLLVIGVPSAALAIVLFLLVYSFFGVFIYNGFNLDTFVSIDSYVRVKKSEHMASICDGYHWYDYLYEVLGLIMTFIDTLHGKLFTITFMLLYAYGCLDYSSNITPNTNNLKNGLLAINVGLIVTCLSMIVDYFQKNMPKTSPAEE
jgi:hypothetical protein